MIISIISIIANILFFVVMNLKLYNDHSIMSDGTERHWHNSPVDRLDSADMNALLYIEIALAAVSIITSILYLVGIRNNVIKVIQLVATIASAVLFVIIMIVAGITHPKY